MYNTDAATILPRSIASTVVIVRTSEMMADTSADVTGREAFAMQMPSSVEESEPSDPEMRKPKMRPQRKIARKRAPGPKIAMAPHLQFGWFGRSFW